ncbi:BTAD domain-containing putative transcriptional regulator [Mycobacterium sp. 852002-50816_SCH5313054-b]|uniref:BTAD domain-containing putative transcriptional regulator n=1 Tax=Mycobacterium sp. 852002-50816_SCH5313054-b TaxID=1834092 RepID=UPI0008300D60
MELGVLGPLQVRQAGLPVAIPGAKPRAILTMLGLHDGSVVSADSFVELLWGDDPPRTAAKALQTHISLLRRTLGDGFVLTQGSGWTLAETAVDAARYTAAARSGRDAAAAGDDSRAVVCFDEALALWRGIPELPDGRRGTPEKTRWIEAHAALVEDRADALLATGRAAEVVGELEAAVADAPLRERRWGQLMLALYRAGRQGEALGAYQRVRALLADELGVDPGPNLRRLEALIVAQDAALEVPATQRSSSVTRAVTFLLTDIEGSTAAWEAEAGAMAVALARHDELVEQVVTSRGGRLIKTRGEGDATFSVFERPSAAAAAAIELQDAIVHEPWALSEPMRVRVALHTGEAELRDGDYFGRSVNRAARLRSLAVGGQILCSGATAELVIDSLPDHVALADLGRRELRNLARPEHVFELRLSTAGDHPEPVSPDVPMERPTLPAVLAGPGPFVGRGNELQRLFSVWQKALAGGTNAALIAGEPGVGKTRLAGEWSRQAYDQGALVIYGRCDEDLGAPYQPFAEALRALLPCLGAGGLRGLRGVEALLALVPGLTDILPDLAAPTRADPDTERYALFDAVVAVLGVASANAPVVLILDDLHWAAKPTLLLLRHLLRFGEQARVQIIGTYRSTDLDRSHPLAAMLADLHRDGSGNRIQLSGLDEDDVTAYVAEAGYHDEELARALASVTGGNPFFLIEALRHVDESGGRWDQSTLPQGVREAVSRRLTRLSPETNKALAAAAVAGSRFDLELVERVVGDDLVDAFDEACKAGIVIEEPGGRYRFNHALVRQSLLAELPSVRRMRLHQRIAATLESQPGADDELLAELAHHYFECAWAGNAAKAVEYCRRAADQAMARLAYEGAADLYDHALHALEEIDDELPDRDDQAAELLVARCEALLAAGDVVSAAGAVSQLQGTTVDSARLAAWATCFDGQLSMLAHPERLDEIEAALSAAAAKLAELDDAAGEAKAHTIRAGCLARLGRIGDCEIALDDALTAARRAREHRRVNSVLANAPLAALWGPNPVPRAGGRCLDVVRLLRITTDSPAVEATSTRCQAVLEAFRGRAAAARRMIDSARRTVTELGLRHALLEVEQFAGIVELVVDEPAAAEPHLLKAYNGFRRMGLDADTAETAALLGRTCLALDRDSEAAELCAESERLAGHALKPSIAWRTLRAQLLARSGDHGEARRVAEAAVSLAERTDALVDHGDACLTLAMVLGAAGDVSGARAAAERAVSLYERKGAAALAEKARGIVGKRPGPPAPPQAPSLEVTNACVQAGNRLIDAVNREAWDEVAQSLAPYVATESRRKIVGFSRIDVPSSQWPQDMRRYLETGMVRYHHTALAVRGERLALSRLEVGTDDQSSGAPQDEMLQVVGLDAEGRIALQVKFDVEDIDAALAELDATHARFENERRPARRLENRAARVFEHVWSHFAAQDWDALAEAVADNYAGVDHRRVVSAETQHSRDDVVRDLQAAAGVGFTISMLSAMAIRGERLVLARVRASGRDPEAIQNDALNVVQIDGDERIAHVVTFDPDDFDAAVAELDARYAAGEAAEYSRTWAVISGALVAHNGRKMASATQDVVTIDHRRVAAFAPGEGIGYIRAGWDLDQKLDIYIETVHRVSELGAVFSWAGNGASPEGFAAEWRGVDLMMVDGELLSRVEVFDEADIDAAIAKFDQLSRPTRRLENAASRTFERMQACFTAPDWDALADALVDDVHNEDRRRVVNAGVLRGRGAVVETMRWAADLGVTHATSHVIATRGERLVLAHAGYSQGDEDPETFRADALQLAEVDADERLTAIIVFDLDDFDAALAELDARYIAGEAADYSQTWSVIAGAYAALNRHEIASTTPNFANIDHRRGTRFAPGDLIAYVRATWDLAQDGSTYIEAVHRLNNLGAVVTHVTHGSSRQGFDAEWREVFLLTVEDDLLGRCELFDESGLNAAITRFDQLSRPERLENQAARVFEHVWSHYAARKWDAMAQSVAENYCGVDHRLVVIADIQHGREDVVRDLQAAAEVGFAISMVSAVAIRGERLVLARVRASGHDPQAISNDALNVVEIDDDERIAKVATFDLDDLDAAIAELDARYIVGEAVPYSRTWSVITRAYDALNRRELPPTTPDWVNIDHRRGTSFASGEMPAILDAAWNLTMDLSHTITTVHRLTDLGSVLTNTSHETSQEGFDAEWRVITVATVEGDLLSRCEIFDEADLDGALARFDELSLPTRRLENAASQAGERFLTRFASGDWDAMTQMLADNFSNDDRRRVVGVGLRSGRGAQIADMRTIADLFSTKVTLTTIATRGKRVALVHLRFTARDHGSEAFVLETAGVLEINSDEQIVAVVFFDVDGIDAALEEVDARYLAGDAAANSHAWSVVAASYAALNRHELPLTTPDCVNIDHRRETAFGPGDVTEYIGAGWDLEQEVNIYVEQVHGLTSCGAVITYAAHETAQGGVDAEWRGLAVLLVDGDLVNRVEVFDEADLAAALARFEELRPRTPRLENAASRVYDRMNALFLARDWDAVSKSLAQDVSTDDRRRAVNSGRRKGRDAVTTEIAGFADIGVTNITSDVIATRGEHLALTRARTSGPGQPLDSFHAEVLHVVEIDADEGILAMVVFDVEDLGQAFDELDTRYLAGEAAPHARVWKFGMDAIAELNRHEPGPNVRQLKYVDHRRIPFASGSDFGRGVEELWALVPDAHYRVPCMHALDSRGTVVTFVIEGTDEHGNELQWRRTLLFASEGPRLEVYEDADLDAALARFEELRPQPRRLENAASRVHGHLKACVGARDWNPVGEILADDIVIEDRRRAVNSGIQYGRAAAIADMRSAIDLGLRNISLTVIATRGDRLELSRTRVSQHGQPEAFGIEFFSVLEINDDERVAARIAFDIDDIGAAFDELDARYLAGEAASLADTWSVVARVPAQFNRHELFATTPDPVYIDHRRLVSIEGADLAASVRAVWDITSGSSAYIEAVHRLSDRGAVFTEVLKMTSRDGFDAEVWMIMVFTVEDGLISRVEVFDEADLDAALARFDELQPQPPRLENAASRLGERFFAHVESHEWDAMAEIVAEDSFFADRRRVVNVGVWHGRDDVIANVRVLDEIEANLTFTVIATRGERLALTRVHSLNRDLRHGEFEVELLSIVETDAENGIAMLITLDPNDIDTAFEELDARYVAGEAAAHAHMWSVLMRAFAALNRREVPAMMPDWVRIDHRSLAPFEAGDWAAFLHATWDVTPNLFSYIEVVHRLSDFGAVVTHVAHGTSQDGLDAEWRIVDVFTVDGDLVSGAELFDEANLDAALARFEELDRPPVPLDNAATRIWSGLADAYNRRDLDGFFALTSADLRYDDRRKGLRDAFEGPARRKNMQAMFEAAPSGSRLTVEAIASRGQHLSLTRAHYGDPDDPDAPTVEMLQITEVGRDGLLHACVSFDPDDMDGAFAELTARWNDSGEAAHPEVLGAT